jgi:pyruvate dehydrogenase (quinone)
VSCPRGETIKHGGGHLGVAEDLRPIGEGGFTARKPGELKKAISDALTVDGPTIVDAVVVANELPNLPHLDLELLGQVARAKVKEAVLAVTGG